MTSRPSMCSSCAKQDPGFSTHQPPITPVAIVASGVCGYIYEDLASHPSCPCPGRKSAIARRMPSKMVALSTFNPSCYLPSSLSARLPSAIACAPPPTVVRSVFDTITAPVTSTYSALRTTMDAVLGLPFLSLLMLPTYTSYSTSLNLVFFYITWSTLVLSHPPLKVEIVASLAVRMLFYVLPSLFFLAFDIVAPGLSGSFKNFGKDGLPLTNRSRKNVFRYAQVVGWSLANVLLSVSLQGLVEWILVKNLGWRSALRVTSALPLPWAMAKDLLKGFVLRDALSFLVNRYLLHPPSTPNALVRDLSSLHMGWYHKAVKVPFPLSPTYDHPLIFVLRSFLPMYLPAMLWRFHALTFVIYLGIISLEETFTHSGYSRLPTNFVLGGIAHRNELHCLTQGKGNYGTWGMCDWLAGTTIGPEAPEDVIEELDEADVQRKVIKGADRGIAKVKRIAAKGDRDGNPIPIPKGRRKRQVVRSDDSE